MTETDIPALIVQQVPVRGRFVWEDQTPIVGQTILFTPKAKVRKNTTALVTLVGQSIRVRLDELGQFVTLLAATDDPNMIPSDWTWHVKEEWLGGRAYDIPVPLAQQTVGVDLTEVAPAPASGGVGWETGPAGPPGPPGVPGRDAESTTRWLQGDGPPSDAIPGARPGDYYIDNLSGLYYVLV